MKRLVTSYQLPLRWNCEGHLVIRSDRTAWGLVFILGALLWAGIWLVMVLDMPDPGVFYDLWEEPFHVDLTEMHRETNEMLERARELGVDVEPLEGPPLRVDRPGGFKWGWFFLLVINHGIVLLGVAIGIRLLFAGTAVVLDREQGKVGWREARLLRTTTTAHDISEVILALHPAEIINPRGFDWHGFAVTLLVPPSRTLDIARGKKEDALEVYAAKITEATGLELGRTDALLT